MEIREEKTEAISRMLMEIPSPPESLWIEGPLPDQSKKYLAVVGSRALSPYGRDITARIIEGLAGYPIYIVSGLALGADAAAHRAALTYGLPTIAVPGSGLDPKAISPRSNAGLARDILKAGGTLLSEHEPMYLPQKFDFPSRNRIMAGMSHAVLMIEAGDKSGTLITGRLATEYNRDLLCVPHRAGDPHGYGAELFLRLGATLVTRSEHILESLGLKVEEGVQKPLPFLEGVELTVYEYLSEPKTRDDLVRATGLPIGALLTTLVTLELKGVARERLGLWTRI